MWNRLDLIFKSAYNPIMKIHNKEQAINYFGSVKKMAEALGVTRQAIYMWRDELSQDKQDRILGAITRLNMISGDLEKKTSNEDVKILIIDGNKQVKIIESYMSNSENDIIPSLINMYNQVLDEYKSYKVINGIQL